MCFLKGRVSHYSFWPSKEGGREEEREDDDDAQLKASSGRSHCPAKISGRT